MSNLDADPPEAENANIQLRQAQPVDAAAIHALMRPYVMQRLLLARTEAEIIELTRHGFVAFAETEGHAGKLIGFSAIEIYGPKLAELQCLAVDTAFQGSGGKTTRQRVCRTSPGTQRDGNTRHQLIEGFLQSCGFDYSLPDQKKALFFQLR